jgi:integrase
VKVIRSKRDKKKIIIPGQEDLRALLITADAQFPAFRPLVMTVIFPGLRSSEIRALRRCDVDLKAGAITVEQRADQWGVIGSPKSQAGHRTIPIPPMLVSELRAWMLRSPPSTLGLLFPNSEGGVKLHSNMLNREYWPLQVAAGLTRKGRGGKLRARYDFHSLRHAQQAPG